MKLKWLAPFLLLSFQAFAAGGSGDPACAKNYLSLRKSPNGPVSWKIAKYMPLMKMESKSGWVKVQDFDGETHWAPAKELTSSFRCVMVKSAIAAMREGPASNAQPSDLRTVDKYTPFKRLEGGGEWVHVEDETGRQAWIHENNLWKPAKIQSVNF